MSVRCPECGSDEVYSEEHEVRAERRTSKGVVEKPLVETYYECQCGFAWSQREEADS